MRLALLQAAKVLGKTKTNPVKINSIVTKASKLKKLKNILTINSLPLVSVDFNHNSSSSIFDVTQTQVVKGKFCRYYPGMIMSGVSLIEW